MLGHFNVSLNIEDGIRGTSGVSMGMAEFKECVQNIGVEDINHSGLHYMWNQRLHADSGIIKKLDIVMGNGAFISLFINSYAIFLSIPNLGSLSSCFKDTNGKKQ